MTAFMIVTVCLVTLGAALAVQSVGFAKEKQRG
ncbi:hypothetical protein TRM7557_01046 [Tritonibacter multivorans]|uniref:Uncharacterized protein n=1 Tax=Tritonibacter multivorans TaxID=928856 RepID=A0A0P1GN51_9RHOB|nr:hypothetical protein TRM7557_01046 [Tritonibacter multivorans]